MPHSFRTEINCPPLSPIGLHDPVITCGSCFADQFGAWLSKFKFKVAANPLGITYNPVSMHQQLLNALTLTVDQNFFTERDGSWFHYQYHSQWHAADKETLTQALLDNQKEVKKFLSTANVLILTYGTSWVYRMTETKSVVANCHKMPAKLFDKSLFTQTEILNSFAKLHQAIKEINPTLRIIITVSPVRHIKDTLPLNQVSKSLLRLVCQQLEENYPEVSYFPSYEIMMDDLRDYRFYDRDMIHPSAEALDYINQKFADQYFTSDTQEFIKVWRGVDKALAHRPFQANSPAHQKFVVHTLDTLNQLRARVPVESEIKYLQSQLNHHD